MTAAEKKDIYALLKTSSDWVSGFSTEDFGSSLLFEDDVEMAAEQNYASKTAEQMGKIAQPVHNAQNGQTEAATSEGSAQGGTDVFAVKEKLNALAQKISVCKNCVLCQKRTNAVPGEGVTNPFVMVIGEGPGEDEDKTGRPFVGKAGQLLDKMLYAIQLDRECNCYIANIVKCRPPMNRAPMKDEADSCSGYLQAQIHALKPKMILALGRTAAQNLLKTEEGINALRGKFFELNGIPLLATYHPSALLRDEALKRPAWNDLKVFRTKLSELCPGYDESFKQKHV